ncbi:hypothetical protein [Streptomyces lanatus]|uniref:Uncharacterized protein n=1 Tax=Streptomyces lanatus TaxID=66900 RepID=A0ABV1Y7Z7_9ACTN|nr:hypothetical protein [Streptomyces lanatus]
MPGAQVPPPGGGGSGRKVIGSLLAVFGVLGMLGGGALTAHAYSNAGQEIPNDEYGSVMWRDEPVDSVFPVTLGGRGGYNGGLYDPKQAIWHRVGISPETECDKGLTRYTLKAANDNGCKAVLRATYVDPTANMVATVAVVVLPEGPESGPREKVYSAYQNHLYDDGVVAPYAVPGTLAAKWKHRNGSALAPVGGENMPYVVAASVGSVDGYVAGDLPGEWSDDSDTDRESWSANAEDLVTLFRAHMDRLQRGDTQ